MKRLLLFCMLLAGLAAGCTTIHQSAQGTASLHEEWAVLPFLNNTETPYAGERAESIATALLYARGVTRVTTVPAEQREADQLLPERGVKRQQEALAWARAKGIRYVMSGSVTEWRYKVGLDGEPVVGITLQVLQLPEATVIWSGSGSKSGWSRDAVSAVAQQVLEDLIAGIPAVR